MTLLFIFLDLEQKLTLPYTWYATTHRNTTHQTALQHSQCHCPCICIHITGKEQPQHTELRFAMRTSSAYAEMLASLAFPLRWALAPSALSHATRSILALRTRSLLANPRAESLTKTTPAQTLYKGRVFFILSHGHDIMLCNAITQCV